MTTGIYDVKLFLTDHTGVAPKSETEGYRSICLFHADTSYDMFVHKVTGRYYCFACGAHGSNLIDLVVNLYDVPDLDEETECALDILWFFTKEGLGNEFHTRDLALEKTAQEQLEIRAQRNLLAAKEYYNGNFFGDVLANKNYDNLTAGYIYLYTRGITEEALKQYRIIDYRRYPQHPLFIPYAFNGDCFGYENRRISTQAWPKVVTMPGTKKSDFVHGFSLQDDMIGLVTEGAIDQLMAWQYGWKEHSQFSILGSHVSFNQALAMAQSNCKYYIGAFDNDLAGEKAYASLVEQMKPYNKKILKMKTGSCGLSFITEKKFIECLDECLAQIGLTHEEVLCNVE